MKDNVVEFPKKEEPKMSPEDLRLLIEQNEFLKLWLKCLNGISMTKEDDLLNYEELWNKIALNKKIESGPVTEQDLDFYFNLFSCGLDNFGEQCFTKLAETNPGVLGHGIKCFIEVLSQKADQENN